MQDNVAICVSNDNFYVTPYQTIDAIVNAGFKNVFIQWYNKDWKPTQEEQLAYIKSKGLNVIFAHLEYKHINSIWENTILGDEIINNYKKDIKICNDNNIKMVCMHLTAHKEAPMYSKIGVKRIKELNNYAKNLGVKIVFENTQIKGYLEYVISNINDVNIGICLDAGHNHAHFNDELNMDLFKDKIYLLHLHDNHGNRIDEHLIPFDGDINWNYVTNKLKENNYKGYTTLELVYSDSYKDITIEDFYEKAYKVSLKLDGMINNYK